MENLWINAHKFIIDSKVGDHYESGGQKVSVIKRTPRRIYLSNNKTITIQRSKDGGFYFLNGKNVNQTLRDIEGYLLFLKHDPHF